MGRLATVSPAGPCRSKYATGTVAGLLIGFLFTTWLRQALLPCLRPPAPLIFSPPPPHTRKIEQRIVVGIMTAQKFLDTRAQAILDTWAYDFPGRVIFFVGENVTVAPSQQHLPIVRLPHVDDSVYPPILKSFLMVKYLYDTLNPGFDWFLRIDDDAYVYVKRLTRFLNKLDPNEAYYMGQPGFGKGDELGRLGFKEGENYCMGGTGMIFSKETLRRFVPNIKQCLKSLVVNHEDVELGRCVMRHAQTSCVLAQQASDRFLNMYHDAAREARDPLFTRDALILHPLKQHELQHTVHYEESLAQLIAVETEENLLRSTLSPPKPAPQPRQPWQFISRSQYMLESENPRRGIHPSLKAVIKQFGSQVVSQLNENAAKRNRVIFFRGLYYAYQRLVPNTSIDYVLDYSLRYQRLNNKPVKAINVRRHSYFSQEIQPARLVERRVLKPVKVQFVLALRGRAATFSRFLDNVAAELLVPREEVTLSVILFDSPENDAILQRFVQLRSDYPSASASIHTVAGNFSRGIGLQAGADLHQPNDLLFFLDVDIILNKRLLAHVRAQTIQGLQVFYPIVFSQYSAAYQCATCNPLHPQNGYWRQFGFGLVAAYQSDLAAAGNWNVDIKGWGVEDVDLVTRFLKIGINVMRAPEPYLLHIYHPVICPADLPAKQYKMCLGTMQSTMASQNRLAQMWLENEQNTVS